jgi:hypothetical protein
MAKKEKKEKEPIVSIYLEKDGETKEIEMRTHK